MQTRIWPTSERLPSTSQFCQLSSLAALALITLGLSAQVSPANSDLPADQQVIAFLTESIDWYHHCAIERQIATEPVDLVFLEDSRPSAGEILQLSFDFARADAQSSSAQADSPKETASGAPELARLVQLQDKTELQRRQASEEMEVIKNQLKTARNADRRKLEAALDATQSRLDVLNAGLATIGQSVDFMRTFTNRETGDLASTIDDLARTVPDVSGPKTVAPAAENLASFLSAKLGDSGVLALSSEVSALGRKLNILDDEIRRTESLRQYSDALRNPLLASINKRLPALAEKAFQASDLSELQLQKTKLDEFAALVKALSPAIVALDKQRILLAAYTTRLKSWRAAVIAEDKKAWRKLISRLLGAAVVIAALVLIGAVVRRVTRRHMGDTEGRHIVLVTQRVILWATIVGVAAFAFASDLTSLATFFGLVAAGVAVALQSVIVSAVSYFVLVGRRGLRIGDKVQISGVSGEVTDIGWLQFQIKEIDTRTQQPTGNVVTFSNSIVLAAPSTGLSKFNPRHLKAPELEVAAKAAQS
jgi:mechanosensitive ion channel-like protein